MRIRDISVPASSRLIIVGGFLGAGKTTFISSFFRWLSTRDIRCGVITNDQGGSLIDTATVKAAGLSSVAEVTGGCFCCRVDELVNHLDTFEADLSGAGGLVLLAEPVGSCTDLSSTLIRPLQQVYRRPIAIAPLVVLMDATRALSFFCGRKSKREFSKDVSYIILKQLEDAEWILITKIDTIDGNEVAKIVSAATGRYPRKNVFPISTLEDVGCEEVFAALASGGNLFSGDESLEVDYARYANGEALLGWHDYDASLHSSSEFDGNAWLMELFRSVSEALEDSEICVAHFKATLTGEAGEGRCRVHLVMSGDVPSVVEELSRPITRGALTINLRAEGDPLILAEAVSLGLAKSNSSIDIMASVSNAFSPAAPVPRHRLLS